MSVYYRPEIIKICRDRCMELAVNTGTPRRYAAPLFEAAEIIDQLQRELKEARGEHADGTGGR